MKCPFCDRIAQGDVLIHGDLAVALRDGFPVSPGHALIVPRRHEADFFQLSDEERAALWALLPAVRAAIEATCEPQAYNVGINAGRAAGQTIDHVHVHVIPRYSGDVTDPRGGIRWILPDRARYWR